MSGYGTGKAKEEGRKDGQTCVGSFGHPAVDSDHLGSLDICPV